MRRSVREHKVLVCGPCALVHAVQACGHVAGACVQAVSIQPDTPEALTGLGLSFKELGQLQQAEQAFESVLRYQPDNALALGNIAGLYFDQGKLAQVCPPGLLQPSG